MEGALQIAEEPTLLPPSFMRGVAEGRGEPEYLHSKYSEMPTFLRKVGTPSTLAKSRLRRLLAARACGRRDLAALGPLPRWGRQESF